MPASHACADRRDPRLGLETPRLDAELLLAHAIGVDRTAVLAHPEAPVGATAEAVYREAIERRSRGEPVAYLRGIKEFHGIALAVDPRALIPRPETERVVDLALDEVMRRLTAGGPTGLGRPAAGHRHRDRQRRDRRRARRRAAGAARAPRGRAHHRVRRRPRCPRPGAGERRRARGRGSPALRWRRPAAAGGGRAVGGHRRQPAVCPFGRDGRPAGTHAPTSRRSPSMAVRTAWRSSIACSTGCPRGWPTAGPPSSRSAPTRGRPSSTMSRSHLPGWSCRVEADLAGLPGRRHRGAP